jgi:hypothetical protein
MECANDALCVPKGASYRIGSTGREVCVNVQRLGEFHKTFVHSAESLDRKIVPSVWADGRKR